MFDYPRAHGTHFTSFHYSFASFHFYKWNLCMHQIMNGMSWLALHPISYPPSSIYIYIYQGGAPVARRKTWVTTLYSHQLLLKGPRVPAWNPIVKWRWLKECHDIPSNSMPLSIRYHVYIYIYIHMQMCTIYQIHSNTSQCLLLKSLISSWYREICYSLTTHFSSFHGPSMDSQPSPGRLVHVILHPIAQDHAGPEAAEDAGS